MSDLTTLKEDHVNEALEPETWVNRVARLLKLYFMQALAEFIGTDGIFSATDFNVSGTTPSNLTLSSGRGYFGATGVREFARNSASQAIATLGNGTHSIYVDENGIYQVASGTKTHKVAEVVITAGALTSINNLPSGRVNLGNWLQPLVGLDITKVSARPRWFKFSKTYADLSTGAGSNNIELFSLPARGVIHAVIIKHTTPFTGGTISAYTLSVGITGNLTKYTSAHSVFGAAADTTFLISNVVGMENFGSVTSIKLSAISTGANLSAATQGAVEVYVLASLV